MSLVRSIMRDAMKLGGGANGQQLPALTSLFASTSLIAALRDPGHDMVAFVCQDRFRPALEKSNNALRRTLWRARDATKPCPFEEDDDCSIAGHRRRCARCLAKRTLRLHATCEHRGCHTALEPGHAVRVDAIVDSWRLYRLADGSLTSRDVNSCDNSRTNLACGVLHHGKRPAHLSPLRFDIVLLLLVLSLVFAVFLVLLFSHLILKYIDLYVLMIAYSTQSAPPLSATNFGIRES